MRARSDSRFYELTPNQFVDVRFGAARGRGSVTVAAIQRDRSDTDQCRVSLPASGVRRNGSNANFRQTGPMAGRGRSQGTEINKQAAR